MSNRPQFIGLIDKPIVEEHPIQFFYAEQDKPTPMPGAYIDYKADQHQARHLKRDPRIKEHELLAQHGSELLMQIMETNLDIHLIINSPGGNIGSWIKYANALNQLRYEGATINTYVLERAFGLAAHIFTDSEKQSILQTSDLIFEAGSMSPQELRDRILKAATTDQTVLTPLIIDERVNSNLQEAEKTWMRIKQFLLSNPGAKHRKDVKKMLEGMDARGERRLPMTGEDLNMAGCPLTTYNSVRDMFEGFCEQTGIEFADLPKSPVSETFTVAAIEEQIKEETGIHAAILIEKNPNGIHAARIISGNSHHISEHEQRILDIINSQMYANHFSAQSTQN